MLAAGNLHEAVRQIIKYLSSIFFYNEEPLGKINYCKKEKNLTPPLPMEFLLKPNIGASASFDLNTNCFCYTYGQVTHVPLEKGVSLYLW